MSRRRWLSAASKAAGLRRGSDAHSSHHWVAQSSNRRREPLGSTQAPPSLDASSLVSQRSASSLLAGEAAAVQPAVRSPVAGSVRLGPIRAVLDRWHRLGSLPGYRWQLARVDPTGSDEGVQVAGSDAEVAAAFRVGDAALEHQPAHEPHARAQALGGLLD